MKAATIYRGIFLTGATGVLGGSLLKELLGGSEARLFCLVRATSPEEGKRRLLTFLRAYDPKLSLRTEFEKRVEVLVGDVASPRLGLSEEKYESLTRSVDATLHAAANTNLFLNLRRIEPTNVGGTRHIIRFALSTRSRYLCYVSTYTVMGDKTFDPTVVFRESDYDLGQGFPHMSYQRTKFLAEGLVRAAGRDGLRWNIMRPGQIFGESATGNYPYGHANIIGLFYDIFKTVIETRVAFSSRVHFDVVPVDYVARGIVELGLARETVGETYHLTNPDRKTYSEVISLLRDCGYPIEFVTQQEYKRRLFEREITLEGEEYKSPTTSAFRWWFKREPFDFSRSAITDCDYTRELLATAGVHCAPIDGRLIATYLQAGIGRKYFPPCPEKGNTYDEMVGMGRPEAVLSDGEQTGPLAMD